jgi:hypothetical protein
MGEREGEDRRFERGAHAKMLVTFMREGGTTWRPGEMA